MKFDFLKLTQHKVLIITGILIATWSHDHYCRYKPRYFTLWNGKYHSYLGHNPRIFLTGPRAKPSARSKKPRIMT